jgi:uncharacterized protein YgiM (DUF1202 family)
MRNRARGLAAALLIAGFAHGADISELAVEPGRFEGRIEGDQIVDYVFAGSAGANTSIALEIDNSAGYFNLMRGKDPAAIHIGSVNGNAWQGNLPAAGDYRARVYLMRNAARRGESANYALTIATGAPSADYADGLAGGPDFWEVANVRADDTLNVRSLPGTDHEIVGQLANGDRVRNLGCRMEGASRWCQVEAVTEQSFKGWVNGAYLREASAPVSGAADSQATGIIPCAVAQGQPSGSCAFRVSRGANGNAAVWIALPSGGERYIEFRDGVPANTDPGFQLRHERTGDLNLVRVGVERYELPDALIYGG